ncbi:MAG: hypothetical protein AAGL89_00475, partial [Pseudomonadota bacterium]
MSKSPNGLMALGLGGAGIVAGLAIAVPSDGFGTSASEQAASDIAAAQERIEAAQSAMATQQAEFDALINEIASRELSTGPAADSIVGYGLGRTATDAEVAAWDIDVRPDGLGLP